MVRKLSKSKIMDRVHNLNKMKGKRRELRNTPTDAEKFLWHELKKGQLNGKKLGGNKALEIISLIFTVPKRD